MSKCLLLSNCITFLIPQEQGRVKRPTNQWLCAVKKNSSIEEKGGQTIDSLLEGTIRGYVNRPPPEII